MHTLSPIAAVEASEPGALAGFVSSCSCGLELKSSLRTALEADRVAHADWHARQAAGNNSFDRMRADRDERQAAEYERRLLAALDGEHGVAAQDVARKAQAARAATIKRDMTTMGPEAALRKAASSTSPAVDARGSLLLVTTAHPSLITHTLDGEVHPNLGRLIQPRHTSSIEKTAAAGIPWAADNDCFQGLDAAAYVRMLDRIVGLDGCLFVTVPDVVADVEATFDYFDVWIGELEARDLPAALVAQDGLEHALARVQWDRIEAVFIGGSTEWKEGAGALAVARAARARGKFVHWGRVNTRRRFDLIVAGGVADSFDGSKWARFRKTYLDIGLSWMHETARKDHNSMSPTYRFELDTQADNETDATILGEVLIGAVRDERNNPDEPVQLRFWPLEGADVPATEGRQS